MCLIRNSMEKENTTTSPDSKGISSKEKSFFGRLWKKKFPSVMLNLLAMLAVMLLLPYLTLLWIDHYTRHGEFREVPEVCGLQLDEASSVLQGHDLKYTVVERRYSANSAPDEVLAQYPDAGSKVKEDRKIGLVLNTSERPMRSIPSVIDNRTFREAESHIKAAGFVIEKIQYMPGERDWVYELRCDGEKLSNGQAVPQGSKLVVVIGDGRPRQKVEETETPENN